jgi:hypothetical protein
MCQERRTHIGDGPAANPYDRQHFPDDSADSTSPGVNLQRLECVGLHSLKARHGADQSMSHRRVALNPATELFVAYNLNRDEHAAWATDVLAADVEAVLNRALASDRYMCAEESAGLMADPIAPPTPDGRTTTELAPGIER